MIRGTLSAEDALTDVMANAGTDNKFSDVGSFCGASFHLGILQAAKWIATQVREALLTAAKANPSYRLVITGHSLGAGVAAILGLAFDQGVCLDDPVGASNPAQYSGGYGTQPRCLDRVGSTASNGESISALHAGSESGFGLPNAGFSHVESYAFACPSVATEDVSSGERAKRVVTTIVCSRDMIPRTCGRNIDALLHEVSMKSVHTRMIDAVGSAVGGILAEKAETRHENVEFQDPQHYPIGYCYLIAHPGGPDATLLCAAPQHFSQILVHPLMLANHMLGHYENGLMRACLGLDVKLPIKGSLWQNQRFFVGTG